MKTSCSSDAAFQIRDYPALTVATAPMDDGEMNRSFGRLFRFISGRNAEAEKIEMTSPVLIDAAKDKKTMSFVMPKKTVEKGVPKPVGESVSLAKVDAARFAVLAQPSQGRDLASPSTRRRLRLQS